MPERREINENDIDRLLAALTDRQIADLYGMTDLEVYRLRKSRQKKPPIPRAKSKPEDPSGA